ncbi:hypothetical protein ACFL5C_00560 [Candidatus Omnitrophota bacterium]
MKIVKFIVLVALLVVPPIVFFGGMVEGAKLTEKVPALYVSPLKLVSASDYPFDEGGRGIMYELGFENELWGSKAWYFLVNRTTTKDELRNVIGKLDSDINDPNYPLQPEVTEQGRIFAYPGGYDTVIYGRYSTAGKVVNIIGVILLAAVVLMFLSRVVKRIVDLFA